MVKLSKIQFNPKTIFSSSLAILDKIKLGITERKMIAIILSAFCIVNHWQKRQDKRLRVINDRGMNNFYADAGTLENMSTILCDAT